MAAAVRYEDGGGAYPRDWLEAVDRLRGASLLARLEARGAAERGEEALRGGGGAPAEGVAEREPVQRQEGGGGVGELHQAAAFDGGGCAGGLHYDRPAVAADARREGAISARTIRPVGGVDLPLRTPRAPSGALLDQIGVGGPLPEVHRPGAVRLYRTQAERDEAFAGQVHRGVYQAGQQAAG